MSTTNAEALGAETTERFLASHVGGDQMPKRYTIRPQPRHLAPRKPEHAALMARYEAGELSFEQMKALWVTCWDSAQLRMQQEEAVVMADMILAVSR